MNIRRLALAAAILPIATVGGLLASVFGMLVVLLHVLAFFSAMFGLFAASAAILYFLFSAQWLWLGASVLIFAGLMNYIATGSVFR